MKRSVVTAALAAVLILAGVGLGQVVESLPGPVVNGQSFAVLSNSRHSVHSGMDDTLPRQVLANVLWAMGRVPRLDTAPRSFYVATRDNVHAYDRAHNTLVVHKSGDWRYSPGSAFEVGIAAARHEEVGMCVQAGLLAGGAFNDTGGPGVVSCPMKWAADHANANWDPEQDIMLVNVYGLAQTAGPDTSLVALSSDSTLPCPHTAGSDTFEIVLMDLGQDSVFSSLPLSLETVSQLLWAAYGPAPHVAFNGSRGLTVPSAAAGYYLTGRLYLVRQEGVDRYHCRRPGGAPATGDHRLENVVAGDRRSQLRAAAGGIPSTAPVYVVVCVEDTGSYRPMQEAGFAGFQLLVQTRALGLGGFLTTPLAVDERDRVALALNLPSGEYPVLVFSVGEVATAIEEHRPPALVEITRARPVMRQGDFLRIEYLLRQPAQVRVEVFDLLGRPVYRILEERQSAGYHSVEWDCADDNAEIVKPGSYVIGVFAPGSVAQHKVTVF